MPKQIPLTRGFVALVSDSDYPGLSQSNWRYANGYAARSIRVDGRTRVVYMHRLIMDAQPGEQVDHRDGNGLNNTRENLRLATAAQNQRNKGVPRNSATGYKGVGPYRNRFHARIRVNGKKIHLGYWDEPMLAALAYDTAARRLHSEFAFLNAPPILAKADVEAVVDRILAGEKPPRHVAERNVSLGKSNYRGVYSERGKWRAKITSSGRTRHLGYFDSEEQAALAYDAAATALHGTRARLNFPPAMTSEL